MTQRLRLRTRLFIAYGAVLLVALAAIATGVFTTVDNARTSAQAVERSSAAIRNATHVWQVLGEIGLELLKREERHRFADDARLDRLERELERSIASARGLARDDEPSLALVAGVERTYRALVDAYRATPPGRPLGPEIAALLDAARASSIALTGESLSHLDDSTTGAHQRAAKVAVLLGATTAIILLVGIWVSVRIARSMTRPLDAMIEGAGRYASGEFDYRVPESGVHEVDALGARFNWMAEALERLRATDVGRLVREQRRNETVLESIDDGLVILDARGCIQRANPVALRQLGSERARVVGSALRDLLPDAGLGAHVATALASGAGEVLAGEFGLDVGGAPRRLGYSLVSFHDGTDPGVVLVMRDVTEQRAFEALRTQFVLRASHALRTPLTGLRMAFDLLDRKLAIPAGSREAELIVTIKHELARLAQLISDLVDLSRLYAESSELDYADTPVSDLLEGARARHAARAEAEGIALEVRDECHGCIVRVDRPHIARVLDNLIDNALRACARGGTVTLSAARHGGDACFEVADTGPGVPLALQARVFEPFTQFGTAGGAGLGLALAREIVARHRGHLALESEPGHGARFAFTLPLA